MIRHLFFILVAVMISGCSWFNNDEQPEKKSFELKSLEVLKSTDRFGWNLLKTVNNTTDPDKNVVISSLSVAQALGMTTNGAENKTLDQMLDVMDFGDLDKMNKAFQNVREVLQTADSKVQVEVANSVWYKKDLPAKDKFSEVVEQYYDASFQGVDFSDEEAAKKLINDWVNDKTKGKIPEIIEDIDAAQYMFLVNAVYFLGKWQYKFDKSATMDDTFYLSDGSTVEVPMMEQENDFQFCSEENFSAVKLPYGDGSFYMVIALPNADYGIDALIDSMNAEKWAAILKSMSKQSLALYMPRFEIECKYKLNEALINMGMDLPFSSVNADFSNMIDAQVFIDEVMHKTYIKADEEGTEAAAATSVGIALTAVGSGPTPFRIDRPFFFAIAEKESGAILFSGKIENPL
jgi:serpin B